MRMYHFWTQNGPFAPFLGPFVLNKKFLVKTIIITLVKTIIYLLALFIVLDFKKFLQQIQLWGCTTFGPKMVHLPQINFFLKIIDIILIYILAPFIEQNF